MAVPTKKENLIAQTLVKESDRGCVILAGALLSEALEDLLKSVCRQELADVKSTVDPLFQGYAPLSTFSARIQLTFALGLLPRAFRDKIEIIRRLRNDFAHDWGPIDFNDPRCVSRLKLLLKEDREEGDNNNEDDKGKTFPGIAGTKEQLTTRIAFILAINKILQTIDVLVTAAKEGRDIRPIVHRMEEQKLWEGPT